MLAASTSQRTIREACGSFYQFKVKCNKHLPPSSDVAQIGEVLLVLLKHPLVPERCTKLIITILINFMYFFLPVNLLHVFSTIAWNHCLKTVNGGIILKKFERQRVPAALYLSSCLKQQKKFIHVEYDTVCIPCLPSLIIKTSYHLICSDIINNSLTQ